MRIDSAVIQMESARRYSSYSSRRAQISVYSGTILNSVLAEGDTKEENTGQTQENKKNKLQEKMDEMNSYSGITRLKHVKISRDTGNVIRQKCLDYLMMIFFGERKAFAYDEILTAASGSGSSSVTGNVAAYQEQTYFEEQEETSFAAAGTVKCADGRQISFNLDVRMSRSFSAYYEKNMMQIQPRLCDPLVINLDGNVTELSDQKFTFDLDADGTKEQVSMPGEGSGYLALDKDSDGRINDGSELFGTKSGDGFSDLAAYDEDHNGWIDENDAVWNRLLIWTKGEDGKDRCYHLSEKNVGAICLTDSSTSFSLNNADNSVNGIIRKTGIFLYENGNVGTVQHLDVAQ